MAKNDNIRIYRLSEPRNETMGGCWLTPYVTNTENAVFENPALVDGPSGNTFIAAVKGHGYEYPAELIRPTTLVSVIPRDCRPINVPERKVQIALELPRIVYGEMLGMFNKEREYHLQARNWAEQQYLRGVARLAERFIVDCAALEKTREDKKNEHAGFEISEYVKNLMQEEVARRAHSK